MKKKHTLKNLIFEQQALAILLFSFAVVVIWVVSSIYFSYTKSTLTQEDTEVIIPLDPKIEMRVIDQLEFRKWWTPEELEKFDISKEDLTVVDATPPPQPVVTPAPVASESAQVSEPVEQPPIPPTTE